MTRTVGPETNETPAEVPDPQQAALRSGSSDLRELLTRNLRQSGIYVAFLVVVVLFAVLTGGTSRNPGNITNIVLQYSYVLVLAIGMALVIIRGHIPLSARAAVPL